MDLNNLFKNNKKVFEPRQAFHGLGSTSLQDQINAMKERRVKNSAMRAALAALTPSNVEGGANG